MKKLFAPIQSGTSDVLDDIGAAAHLLISPRCLILWRQKLALPHVKISNRTIRYRRSDLDKWLDARAVNAPLN